MILKEQKIVEVSKSQLLAEQKVLEEKLLHHTSKAIKKLEEMRCKCRENKV